MRVRLFNDAGALLVYCLAFALAVPATLSPARTIPLMVAATAAEADPYGRL